MSRYFEEEQGIGYRLGTDVKPVLRTIANRFVADHPAVPAVYYLRSQKNFHSSEDYMDEVKLHEKFPDMKPETYVYAWAQLTPPQGGQFHFRFSAYGPVSIYVNGVLSYRTGSVEERFADRVSDICLLLEEGPNSLVFQCVSTPLGCGFHIGSSSYKGRRIQFFAPSLEHQGMGGFVYSNPVSQPVPSDFAIGSSEADTGLSWLPPLEWTEEERKKTVLNQIYGSEESGQTERRILLSVTKVACMVPERCRLDGMVREQTVLYVDGEKCQTLNGRWSVELKLAGGMHTLAFLGSEAELHICTEGGEELELQCPVPLAGRRRIPWLYAGPFSETDEPDLKELLTFQKPVSAGGRLTYWRADLPDLYLRPYNEGVLYGEWNYPLGVTLYGLIQSARILGCESLADYVAGHMKKCADFYEYCVWDKAFYGAAPFLNQLMTADSLDDCGSFASALLEVMKDHDITGGRAIADLVADYIETRQQRLEDGTFYRNHSYLPVMNETMWADDMYMSIPFLCRYYEISGNPVYLEDAVSQVKHFYHYLYMKELQIMSHIYDTHYGLQTKVPWGRGNGWVLFSLTELLEVMPREHEDREEILSIFRQLCEGYERLQGKHGLWHQVLTDQESYEETSCTAMFVYGFARAARFGWVENRACYAAAANRGWEALCHTSVDWKGNIYGVCRGSGYSFSKEYYARDLGWNFNDTHGTGIVLLAGIEVEKMRRNSDGRADI